MGTGDGNIPIGTTAESHQVTFEQFKNVFLADLRSPDFAAEPFSEPGVQSPAAKELLRKAALEAFNLDFCSSIYRLLIEHTRLVNEQQKIFKITETKTIKLVKLANALKTLTTVKNKLEEVQENTQGLVSGEVWGRVQHALSDCEYEVRRNREDHVSMLHPAERKPHDSIGRWEPVLKSYKYELRSLKKKAPDQWLYKQLDSELKRKLKAFKITAMTRYRVMAAALAAYGLKIEPITFKLHSRPKKSRPKVPVKKS